MKLSKYIKAVLVTGTIALFTISVNAAPSQADSYYTALDNYWLFQPGQSFWGQASLNFKATNYCNSVGYNNPGDVSSCRIIDFWEESRDFVPNFSKPASWNVANCSRSDSLSRPLKWMKRADDVAPLKGGPSTIPSHSRTSPHPTRRAQTETLR